MTKKRENVLAWDESFMAIASVAKLRSKDPSTQVGACIVSSDNRILSIGYNGAPNGFNDDEFPWEREGEFTETKYAYVVHAERNAILNFRGSLREFEGATIYITHYPCNECAKEIVQAGIKRVIYLKDAKTHTKEVIASARLLKATGVEVEQIRPLDNFEVDLTQVI